MTSVTFEAATFSDAIKKAARVAPAKVGVAFDKAAGIVLDITPGSGAPCVIRSTDTQVFYLETLEVTDVTGVPVRWRLPSVVLGNVIGTLPPRNGQVLTINQISSSQVEIKSGRMRVKLNLIDNPAYPEWDAIDGGDLTVASNFGAALTRVEWAAWKGGTAPLCGVHVNGTHIIATDRYKIARVPCVVELPNPITLPSGGIGSILKQAGDVSIGFDGNLFVAQPDEWTQYKTTIIGEQYPAAKIEQIAALTYGQEVRISRDELVEYIQRAANFAGSDRAPTLKIFLGKQELAVMMANTEIGLFGDVIEVPGQASHSRFELLFSPKMLIDALTNAPTGNITLKYNDGVKNRPLYIEGDKGYQAWVAPRTDIGPTDS